jgi:hypothetical protein
VLRPGSVCCVPGEDFLGQRLQQKLWTTEWWWLTGWGKEGLVYGMSVTPELLKSSQCCMCKPDEFPYPAAAPAVDHRSCYVLQLTHKLLCAAVTSGAPPTAQGRSK